MTLAERLEGVQEVLEQATAVEYEVELAHTHRRGLETFTVPVVAKEYDPKDYEWVAEQIVAGENCFLPVGDRPPKLDQQWAVINTNDKDSVGAIMDADIDGLMGEVAERIMPFTGRGVPDLFAYNPYEPAIWFIEVKRWGGALQHRQLTWPLEHSEFDHSVMYLKDSRRIEAGGDSATRF